MILNQGIKHSFVGHRKSTAAGFFALTVLLALFITQCTDVEHRDLQNPPIVGLTSPVQLQPEADTVHVGDFVLDPSTVDSIVAPEELELTEDTSDVQLAILDGELRNQMDEIVFWIDGESYHVPLRASLQQEVTLTLGDQDSYENVYLKGEMNDWSESDTQLDQTDDGWEVTLHLEPGSYEYLFVADGNEMLDPNNEETVSNRQGGENSVLTVGEGNRNDEPQLLTDSFDVENIHLKSKNASQIIAFWQNKRIDAELEDGSASINIPSGAEKIDRSFIRAWAFNENGLSNDVLIPLHNGKVVQTTDVLDRDDWEKTTMYFMMIDRFNNGNPENDKEVANEEILPKANYYGGDLAGITEKIEDGYFEDLNINTLWLSPITQNPEGAYGQYPDPETKFSGYHGYWPISSTKVDYRFGTEAELQQLLDTAHEHNMNVILDYVANHVHEEHPVYQEHPEWATDLYLEDGSLNTENWDSHRLTTWFDTFMPTLDFSRPEIVETMTDSALYWLETQSFDGFRHDATKHVQLDFWRMLTRKLKTEVAVPKDKRIYQIGETYGSRSLIASYINTGMLDAQFDFNLYDDAVPVFARDNEPMERLHNSLQESFKYYGNHHLMGNISGNQDRPRFISYAGGELSFEEDAKEAGWKREIGVGDAVGYDRLAMLMAFNMTIPGIPIIYYGDEIGMPGGGDPDNRDMMRFDDLKPEEKQLREITQKLSELREDRLSLIYGDFHPLMVEEQAYAYARNYFEEWTIVLFNKSDEERELSLELPASFSEQTLNAEFGAEFNQQGTLMSVTVPANSFEVLTSDTLN